MKTEESNEKTSDEELFDALTHSYADIPEPTDNEHGTTDEHGIYLPAYGEGADKAVLIEWTAIDEPMKLLQITRRLLHKQWITREMCSAFLDITFQHFGWPKGCPYL